MSLIGTWMQRTAVSWVIYTMTHSAFMLGLTVFASQFPSFLLSLFGGVVSDRYNRYKVLLFTQVASMIQAISLALLVFANRYVVWEIFTLSIVLGIINAFDVPARQSLVHEMINSKMDLPNALALNSSMNNLAMLLGPALSGVVLEKFGAATCFLLNATSFVAVIISLILMKLPQYLPSPIKHKITSDLVEGFVYLKKTPEIGVIMLMLALMSLLVLPYNTLFPVFANIIFKGGAATYGYINSFIGLGAVAGAFFLASLKEGTDLKMVLLGNTIILGIGLMLFSYTSYFPLAMLFAVLSGFGTMSQSTICNTIIQLNSDAKMRGRVVSLFAMSVFGMMPLGSLLIGTVSHKVGASNAVFCEGIMALIIAALFSGFLRRDYLNRRKMKQSEEISLVEKI